MLKTLLFLSNLAEPFVPDDLTANDNELVFQAKSDGSSVNFFSSTTLTSTTLNKYSVYINDAKTTQKINSLTFKANDIVKLVGETTSSFPRFTANKNALIYTVAKFPKFDNNSFSELFYVSNKYHVKYLPRELLKNNPTATNFYRAFGYIDAKTVPDDLFAYTASVTDLTQCFMGSHIVSIPSTLFDNCLQLAELYECFSHTQLTAVPEGLFANNTKLQSVRKCFSNSRIREVPDTLFANCQNLTNVAACFYSTPLNTIPPNLFRNNPTITTTSEVYNGTVVDIYGNEEKPVQGIFNKCESIVSVPEGLFDTLVNVTDFDACFRRCKSLASVPEDLFLYNTLVTRFDKTFEDCKELSCRLKIGSEIVSSVTNFCTNAGQFTVVVPAGTTTETTFRAYAATVNNLIVETYDKNATEPGLMIKRRVTIAKNQDDHGAIIAWQGTESAAVGSIVNLGGPSTVVPIDYSEGLTADYVIASTRGAITTTAFSYPGSLSTSSGICRIVNETTGDIFYGVYGVSGTLYSRYSNGNEIIGGFTTQYDAEYFLKNLKARDDGEAVKMFNEEDVGQVYTISVYAVEASDDPSLELASKFNVTIGEHITDSIVYDTTFRGYALNSTGADGEAMTIGSMSHVSGDQIGNMFVVKYYVIGSLTYRDVLVNLPNMSADIEELYVKDETTGSVVMLERSPTSAYPNRFEAVNVLGTTTDAYAFADSFNTGETHTISIYMIPPSS